MLREYALIADGERGALIGPRGDIAWMCAPRWESPAVLSSLIGGVGAYTVTPVGRCVWGGYYEGPSLIWLNRWITNSGVVECRDALAFPGDPQRIVLLRRIVAVDSPAELDVELDLRAEFGERPLRDVRCSEGSWTGRAGPLNVRWSGAREAAEEPGPRLSFRLALQPGEQRDLVLELSEQSLPDRPPEPAQLWTDTERAWQRAVPEIAGSIAPGDARHSYAVLRGLTSQTGGMVAAATTSLPERAEQGRNYDYRYVWIRDQALAGQAVADCGHPELLDAAVTFVSERLLADGPHLAPAYTVEGGPIPDQQSLDLPGYPGGYDIIGNHVNAQFQLDVFGESLLLLGTAAARDRLTPEGWRAVEVAADSVADRWHEPDAGIWELDQHRWAQSRLSCVAGLHAVAARAPAHQAADWTELADRILSDVRSDCLHPSGRWQRAPDDVGSDGALLLPAVRGLPSEVEPINVRTMHALCAELADDHFLYRFRHQPGPLGDAEGAFLLCGFVMAMAQHRYGDPIEAVRWFERNRSACGPAGLYAEEYDVGERQLRGNLPQAFVHAMMLESSVRLSR